MKKRNNQIQLRRKLLPGRILLFCLLCLLGGLCAETAEAETAQAVPEENLKDLFSGRFSMGVSVQAIDHWNDPLAEIGNEEKEKLITQNFNSLTFGNELKPAYNFDPESETLFRVDPAAEELLDWAKAHDIPVRGHVMVWHSQVDPSIFAKDFKALSQGRVTKNDQDHLDEECLVDRETLISRLRMYIYGLTEYIYSHQYADVVYAWDVVNEASDEAQPDGLRHSWWYRIIGPEYLYYSFLFAREAQVRYSQEYASLYGLDPDADDLSVIRPLLFYNDYNEWYDTRCSAILRFLTEDAFNPDQTLIQSDVISPDGDGTIFGDGLLDGIGMQGHMDDNQNIDQFMTALERYNDAVGRVHITELDVGQTGFAGKREAKQADFYYQFFSRLLEEVQAGIHLENVTFWGLTDDASWRQGANPLLFDGSLVPKAAYYGVRAAAKGEPFSPLLAAMAGKAPADAGRSGTGQSGAGEPQDAGAGEPQDAGDMQEAGASPDAEELPGASSGYTEWIDFEPYKENGVTVTVPPDSAGFFSRGDKPSAVLTLFNKENHTDGAAIGFSLRVSRKTPEATVRREMDPYIGMSVEVTMYAKTADQEMILGLEGNDSADSEASPYGKKLELIRVRTAEGDGEDGWMKLQAAFSIPFGWGSAALYLETDGAEDIFLDDIGFRVTGMADNVPDSEEDVDENTNDMSREKIGTVNPDDMPGGENSTMSREFHMGNGWNLGNTLDAFTDYVPEADDTVTETAWQPYRTTPELFRAVRDAGFASVRIPVSWHNHVDEQFTISEKWLDRVQEIVDMAIAADLNVILNIHHDNDERFGCLYPDAEHFEQSLTFVTRIWQQVANRFAGYDEHLIFEVMNEPRLVGHPREWNADPGDADVLEAMECINKLNQAFVDTVRSVSTEEGKWNRTRYLGCPGYCASPDGVLCDAFQIPADLPENENRILISVHAYTPYNFALKPDGTDFFDPDGPGRDGGIKTMLDRLSEKFVSRGIPVYIGEMGSVDRDGNLESRVRHCEYFAKQAKEHGISIFWWDNGLFDGAGERFAIIDRGTCTFRYPELADAMNR